MFWSGLKELNELSTKICEDFASKFPPSMQGEDKPHAKKQLAAALVSIDNNIGRFLAANPQPGVFKKAKCANEVKWGLKDLGYQAELVDAVTNKVVHGLARTAIKPKTQSGSS
jgi:hypothetical protein